MPRALKRWIAFELKAFEVHGRCFRANPNSSKRYMCHNIKAFFDSRRRAQCGHMLRHCLA